MDNSGNKQTKIKSFEPVANERSMVLILGTMPGEESLRKQQYYAHPRNLFWPVLYGMFDREPDADYAEKLRFLREKRIALWDVFQSCSREGSLDSNIRCGEINGIGGLLEEYTGIKYVFFNGETAEKQFRRHILPVLSRTVFTMRLPSTSPANASIPIHEKQNMWRKIRYALENRVLHKSALDTGIGRIAVYSNGIEIERICLPGSEPDLSGYAVFTEDETARRAKEQIFEYLNGKRRVFDFPVKIQGSPFEQSIYRTLMEVSYGKSVSYKELAEMAGRKGAARAVGQAMKKNPLPLLVPCHRVIGSDGKNVGFIGTRNHPMQNILLQLEKNN